MTEEKEKTVSEQLADQITSWAESSRDEYSWKINPLLSYEGPGTYEGEASMETKDKDTFTTGFELVSRQYSVRDFLRLLENVTILHDGKEYTLRDGVQINHLSLRSPRKGAANVEVKDLDQHMTGLHDILAVTYLDYEEWYRQDAEKYEKEYPDYSFIWEEPSDFATAVNVQDGKVTGVIMDGRDRTDEPYTISCLQKLYDDLDQQFAPLIHDEGAEHLDGIVITICSPWRRQMPYTDKKGKNSRAIYDNEHNVVIIETGTFFYDDEENNELRREVGDYVEEYEL